MKYKILIWALVLLLTLNLVFALGIRPAKTSIISENTDKYEGEFWVVNTNSNEFTVKISVNGEMAEYVEIEEEEINFRNDDDAKSIKFKVELPDVVPAGESTAYIVIEEFLDNADSNIISSKIMIKHKIVIQGPYPNKYIDAKLNFNDLGDDIEFISEVENLGKQDINNVKTTFYVNDKEQKKHTLETNSVSLNKKENKLLIATLEKDVFELGEFEVSAVTRYDDQQLELVKMLLVGKPEVEVTYFDKYFQAYKVNEYSLDLLNKWNKKVENVYVDVEVKKDDQKVDEFRTKSVDIDALLTKRINDYFDAQDKAPGDYLFELTVNFWNSYKMESKTFPAIFLEGDDDALVGKAYGDQGGNSLILLISLTVLITVIVISLLIFFIMKKLKNKV